MLLRQTQWMLDDVAFDLPAGRVTPQKRTELAEILEQLAELVRAAPTVIEVQQHQDSGKVTRLTRSEIDMPRRRALHTHTVASYTHNMGQHPHKEIRKALADAEDAGLTVKQSSGHAWGDIHCGCGNRIAVYTTPKDPENGAKLIRRFTRNHKEHR